MRGKNGLAGLALLLLVAFTVTMTIGAVANASDPAAHTAGLKKCLQKAKQIRNPVKRKKAKRKCKKPLALVRATLTWSGGAPAGDLDLFVFDGSGRRDGNGTVSIPIASISPDVSGASGQETFTDLDFKTRRPFAFGVCYTVGGSQHTPFTITYVTADGATHTDSQNPGSSFHYNYPADGASVPTGYCPAGGG